ncbi:hypothetical protein ACQKCU_26285 [Heyndrickxia sporothermodurans]
MKKIFSILATSACLVTFSLHGGAVKAESIEDPINEVSLENVDISELNAGKEITLEDGTSIKNYSLEEAAKIIAEENGETEEDVLKRLQDSKKMTERSSLTAAAASKSKCATGAVPFARTVTVTSKYKPTVNVWTELCQNSKKQFVIKSIVDISLNRKYNGIVKGFGGSVAVKALNSGKTLYYRVEGTFYNNATSSVGVDVGMNTPNASIQYKSSSTSNYYGYAHVADNIILFK